MNSSLDLYDASVSKQFYDERFANGYMDEWPEQKKRRVGEIIRNLGLPALGDALDFGCGNGVFTEVVRSALPQWRVYGTDFSPLAVKAARARYPDCTFFTTEEGAGEHRQYDFVFSHHVLEHVYELDTLWHEIAQLMKPGAGALHILPCGNQGSFEREICELRRDGIDRARENRYFFEDEGHVRRVDTEQLVGLANRAGMTLRQEYYSNQYYGGVDWITKIGKDFIRTLVDPRYAIDSTAHARLTRIRKKLLGIALARDVLNQVRARWALDKKNPRVWFGLGARLPLLPFCALVDWFISRKADDEWTRSRHDRRGSEMYLYFTRKT